MYEYCTGKHWSLDWMQENQTATYFLRSRLFTYDIHIMKKFNQRWRTGSFVTLLDAILQMRYIARVYQMLQETSF